MEENAQPPAAVQGDIEMPVAAEGLMPAAQGDTDRRLFLLDAYALIYRAYFSFIKAPRINSQRVNTSAAFGFTLALVDLIKREKPTHIAVVFDCAGPTDRHTALVQYKANRQEMPDDIRSNLPYIRRIVEAFNIPVLECEGYEADDVIGTLAKKAEKEGYVTYMVTPDKDFGQLVSEKIFIYKPGRQGSPPELLGPKEVCDRWGLERAEQVADILGLMGDAVDNIPGIPGIGEKTAIKLVQQYGSLEEVIARVDELKGKQQENVREFAMQGLLSKQLATILVDAPVEIDHAALHLDPPDREKVLEVFSELEFRNLTRSVLGEENLMRPATPAGGTRAAKAARPVNSDQMDMFGGDAEEEVEGTSGIPLVELARLSTVEHAYHIAASVEEQEDLARQLASCGCFCFDTETDGLDLRASVGVGLSFCMKAHEAWYVPLPPEAAEAQAVVERFRAVFEDPAIAKVAQNLKYDLLVLRKYGVRVAGALHDTMIAHYLLQPELRHNMDHMAETLLRYRTIPITELIGPKGKGQRTLRDVPVERVAEYAAEDADITWQLYEHLMPRLKEDALEELYRDVEMPLVNVLCDMENEGIRVDVAALRNFSEELSRDILDLEGRIHGLCGAQFNIDSPKQLGDVLFETLKISAKPKRTKTGQYQTSEDVLAELAQAHPVIPLILDHRSLRKLKGTYVDPLPRMVDPGTGRIHTHYRQAVAATGRLSSEDPNLQNIPIRTEKGREIRKTFVPRDENHLLLSADYSQVELRVIAHMSGDKTMQEAFRNGLDIHAATAARVFNVDISAVDREQRSRAKAVNFGIAYGQGAFGLSQVLSIPRGEAKQIIDEYFAQFPGVRSYMDTQIDFARTHGHVRTMLGRRRYLPDITSANQTVRAAAERVAINAPMQGTAADIIKIAMVSIHREIMRSGLRSRLLLQVHDELVFDVELSEADRVQAIVKEHMENALHLDVPLVVDMRMGKNWLEAH
jgi:DNA polymerase I